MSENALFKTTLSKAMAQCSRREFCCSEIRTKLYSWGLGDIDSEKIISMLIKENFINEDRFAQAFVKDKFNYNKWGKVKIAAHLRVKNIPGDIIRTALDVIDNELYKKTLSDLISSHRRFVKAKNQYDLKAKLLRYGLSKGFESSLLYDILKDPED
ncbi:MAG: RecX family transcriptional regulator [Bacteroidetes bacterium]|nr:RecX family transcriptional regulator [Bacteroidota bacterium]